LIVLPDPALAPVISAETVPSVHVKLLGALAVNAIAGLVPLHVAAVFAVVTSGVGLTVTVILYTGPVHVPVVDIGVIRYSIDPAVALLGFVSISLIVAPPPANAPTIPPVFVPSVHVKLAGVLEVNAIFVFVPLQILFTAEFVTTGRGLTVTTTLVAVPTHPSGFEVGVTRYSTVPAVVLLKLVSTWLIVAPDPAVAPDTLPVTEPTVHVKVLATLAVKARLVLSPLQILIGVLVTAGFGLTVTVIV
jgi:hypothetical protein